MPALKAFRFTARPRAIVPVFGSLKPTGACATVYPLTMLLRVLSAQPPVSVLS